MKKIRRSVGLNPGIYQWEWRDEEIAIAKWDIPPASTTQWVNIKAAPDGPQSFFLEGTNNEDIKVCGIDALKDSV